MLGVWLYAIARGPRWLERGLSGFWLGRYGDVVLGSLIVICVVAGDKSVTWCNILDGDTVGAGVDTHRSAKRSSSSMSGSAMTVECRVSQKGKLRDRGVESRE